MVNKYLQNVSDDEFKKIVKESINYKELQQKLNIPYRIKNDILKIKIKDLEICIKHFNSSELSEQTLTFCKFPDNKFIEIVEDSYTYTEIKQKLNINFTDNTIIQQRIHKLNININHFNPAINALKQHAIWNIPENIFTEIIKESYDYKEIIIKLKLSNNVDRNIIKRRIKELKINIDHFDFRKSTKITHTIPLEQILVKSDKYRNGNMIKQKLYDANIKQEICEACGIGNQYNNKKLSLQLEHIDGNNTNNEISNLLLLCYSCHSQTATFCRNKKSLKNKATNNTEIIEKQFENLGINNKCADCTSNINDDIRRCNDCYNKNILSKKFCINKGNIWKYPENDFKNLVTHNYSLNSIQTIINKMNGGNNNTIQNRIDYLNINISHFNLKNAKQKWCAENIELTNKISLKDILVENSTYKNGTGLKQKLYKVGLKEEKCDECGIGNIWNDKKLVLQIDHINGVHTDCRINNLSIKCPNCHSMTDNFCSKNAKNRKPPTKFNCPHCNKEIGNSKQCMECYKNTKKINVNRPSLEQLEEDVQTMPYTTIGKKYNVSDNTIRTWIKNYKKDINYYNPIKQNSTIIIN